MLHFVTTLVSPYTTAEELQTSHCACGYSLHSRHVKVERESGEKNSLPSPTPIYTCYAGKRRHIKPRYTGDFCRATQCNYCRPLSCIKFQICLKLWRYCGDQITGGLHARFWSCNSERDKNRIKLHDKNHLFKWGLRKMKLIFVIAAFRVSRFKILKSRAK